MEENKKYVWYLGYGSNLRKERLYCYIRGGKPEFGKIRNPGCRVKTLPLEDRPYKIKNKIYFGLPDNATRTDNWGKGGVAFITPDESEDENDLTYCRIWKITEDQYQEIRDQEGRRWYDREIVIGDIDGIPIKTITHSVKVDNNIPPSETYRRTIMEGLMETFDLSIDEANEYIRSRE